MPGSYISSLESWNLISVIILSFIGLTPYSREKLFFHNLSTTIAGYHKASQTTSELRILSSFCLNGRPTDASQRTLRRHIRHSRPSQFVTVSSTRCTGYCLQRKRNTKRRWQSKTSLNNDLCNYSGFCSPPPHAFLSFTLTHTHTHTHWHVPLLNFELMVIVNFCDFSIYTKY